jgi:adenine phosphoribosyltransferase
MILNEFNLKNYIGMWQDFPKKGVLFRDINPAMRNNQSFSFLSNRIFEEVKELEVDNVVAIESRGFIIGTMLAMKLNKGLIMIRKSGKLPGPIISKTYSVEYGVATMEIQQDAIAPGQKILIADDLVATGGTSLAAAELVEILGAKVSMFVFVISLEKLNGSNLLREHGYKVYSLLEYSD